jgi:ABC-type multidrug transport system fused ATPase/permease subunit
LSLSFAISLTSLLNWCVRSFAQLEAAMNACERVLYYTENIPQEAPRTSDELEDATSSSTEHSLSNPAVYATSKSGGKADRAAFKWPDKGEITLKNLRMRYRAETPLVLKGLNVTIHGGERIGVVGRTGSGKSSLLLTLLRLVEPSLEEGDYQAPLSIDGVDVLRIGLKDLRSKLGIIPQNPVLFSGTVRSNIDPFDEYSDKQIWDALSRCGMKESVENMPGMLNASIAEYGENLSAGMRQMLVLGRALLKQCRILLLDEATSSVDYETDREIQRTLREAFNQCTILTIAHRINTIMDSDKILVMKDGYVEEFAPPQELLKDENSTFSEIVRHAKSGEHQ